MSTSGPVFVQLNNNWTEQTVVVLDGLRKNCMQLDVGHSTSQQIIQVQNLGSDRGERFVDPLGKLSGVSCQGYIHGVRGYSCSATILLLGRGRGAGCIVVGVEVNLGLVVVLT